MNGRTRKVGRVTAAIGLVALGATLLMDNLGRTWLYTPLLLQLWPALLIGFGAEYLAYHLIERRTPGLHHKFEVGGTLLLLVLILLTSGFASIRDWASLDGSGFMFGTSSNRAESQAVPAEKTRQVVIDIDQGRVQVIPHQLSEVRVEAEYSERGWLPFRSGDASGFQLDVSGDEVVTVRGDAPTAFGLGGLNAVYRVYVPDGLAIKAETGAGSLMVQDYTGSLNLTARVGSVTVERSGGDLKADCSSGAISVKEFAGPVTAESNTGRISITDVTGDLKLSAGTGGIDVQRFGAGLQAEARTGSIEATATAPLTGDLQLRTTTGSIALTLPKESSMQVRAESRTGALTMPDFVAVSGNGPARSGSGTTGGGEHAVSLEANTGSIRLTIR